MCQKLSLPCSPLPASVPFGHHAHPIFGTQGVVDRFGQIKPKVLFACDGYFYNGKTIDRYDTIKKVVDAVPSIDKLVVIPIIGSEKCSELKNAIRLDNFIGSAPTAELTFTQLPFDHPLYIMYSSGTTGVPKGIILGAGGTLIQHLKEHQLHIDLKAEDVLFFFTTCGWMMWNWLISGLATVQRWCYTMVRRSIQTRTPCWT